MVTIGGGTNGRDSARTVKKYASRLLAIVTWATTGRLGRLREDAGMLPPGDIRNHLALADDESVMSSLFNYRFDSGELEGHNFGNLFWRR